MHVGGLALWLVTWWWCLIRQFGGFCQLLKCLFPKGKSSLKTMVLCLVGSGSLSKRTDTQFTPTPLKGQVFISIQFGGLSMVRSLLFSLLLLFPWWCSPSEGLCLPLKWACFLNAFGVRLLTFSSLKTHNDIVIQGLCTLQTVTSSQGIAKHVIGCRTCLMTTSVTPTRNVRVTMEFEVPKRHLLRRT